MSRFVLCRFEQEFLNDLMKNYGKSLRKYFWTGLRDANSRGEYSWAVAGGVKQAVTFSNWNFLEPGECFRDRADKDDIGVVLSPHFHRAPDLRLPSLQSLLVSAYSGSPQQTQAVRRPCGTRGRDKQPQQE